MIDPVQPSQFPWSAVFAVLGTLAGFVLNEVSHVWRLRLEDRRKVGQALAELLEIYRQIRAVPECMEVLRSKIPAPIPKQAEFQLRTMFRAFIPDVDALRQRYQTAVTAVAGAFPVLAYELRRKDMLTPIINQLSSVVGLPDEVGAGFLVKMEDQMVSEVCPVLKSLIQETASLHGRKTRKHVDEVLADKKELPKGFDNFISQAISQMTQQAKQQKSPEAPQSPPQPSVPEPR